MLDAALVFGASGLSQAVNRANVNLGPRHVPGNVLAGIFANASQIGDNIAEISQAMYPTSGDALSGAQVFAVVRT